ncbi:UPF0687 protein C20orf27 homolog isoform X2 [Leptopilina heterotoma]|uniref:UPF0687 protein C20orf27 homolog isoform X2 n=1 Tax=Leptopilina heterotoma TaxID=63436 RepID=UPI001CA8A1D9|nr:UPF0687 protein C20orf27 homolog isoform X2 [Leptopilina heterotoma]
MGDKEHHVHFSGGCSVGKENNIILQPQRHGHIDAHLGFLQLYHRYQIEFSIPWNTCIHGEKNEPPIFTGNLNPHCRTIDLSVERDNLRLKVELFAYKEKILKEEVQITCCPNGAPLSVFLNARVIGKNKGSPLLRNGIRSIAVECDDDEDESSD